MTYYEEKFQWISEHIQLNCNPNNKDYAGINKGHIIVDDENGVKLALVKKWLNYNNLSTLGKVHEITIDKSWDTFFRRTEAHKNNHYLECWNKLVTAAYKANHGLLVINISNIKIFEHCWHLKQLAKQEREMPLWPKYSYDFDNYTQVNIKEFRDDTEKEYGGRLTPEQLVELIEGFMFDGYVLLILDGIKWDEVKEYVKKHLESGEFDAMMQFYRRISFEE